MKHIILAIIFTFVLAFIFTCRNNITSPTCNNTSDMDLESPKAKAFLEKVAGKYAGQNSPVKDGFFFNNDGKECHRYSNGKITAIYNFHHTVNEQRAIYTTVMVGNVINSIFLIDENNIFRTGPYLISQGLLK